MASEKSLSTTEAGFGDVSIRPIQRQDHGLGHAIYADEALEIMAKLDHGNIVLSDAANKALLKKIDLILMPVKLFQ